MESNEPTTMWPIEGQAMIEDYERALAEAPEDPGLRATPRRRARLGPGTLTSMLAGAFIAGAVAGWALSNLVASRRD
jgi:hypothetical protein